MRLWLLGYVPIKKSYYWCRLHKIINKETSYNERRLCIWKTNLQNFHFVQIDNDNNDHPRQFIVTSASNGDVVFQVFESAKTIVAKILEPPPKNVKAVNVGLLPKRDLPKRFDFNFYNLPVNHCDFIQSCKNANSPVIFLLKIVVLFHAFIVSWILTKLLQLATLDIYII